jgi:RNA polymerase sigma factor (sigma-70 family)
LDSIPRDHDERVRFDAFCKAVLRNEARNHMRDLRRQRRHETSLDAVPQAEMDKLSTADHYPSDSFVFSSHGYDLLIDNELVADAFAGLPATEQSILILRCVLDLTDEEIGGLLGMSRSAVQRRRTKTLEELRAKLTALMPKGG